MSYDEYIPISKDRYDIISARYINYIKNLDDPNTEPVTVFDPLSAKQIQELELIREVSKDLQMKKEDYVKKAAQAKIEEEKAAAEKPKETEEPKKEE
ncbi:uncharacterized protein [Epargyreus clarus]|uniref:uncharacterized protein n=1 Tax=Epargyreus clarus TaxID=520877 RepID=UPI003C2D4B1F